MSTGYGIDRRASRLGGGTRHHGGRAQKNMCRRGQQWAGSDPDGRYKKQGVEVPKTECLKDVLERVLPYWKKEIVEDLKAGKTVLIAAHGNSLRALMKDLEGISDDVCGRSPL